jgi:hypothetical protein
MERKEAGGSAKHDSEIGKVKYYFWHHIEMITTIYIIYSTRQIVLFVLGFVIPPALGEKVKLNKQNFSPRTRLTLIQFVGFWRRGEGGKCKNNLFPLNDTWKTSKLKIPNLFQTHLIEIALGREEEALWKTLFLSIVVDIPTRSHMSPFRLNFVERAPFTWLYNV